MILAESEGHDVTRFDVSAPCFTHPASGISGHGVACVVLPDGGFAYAFSTLEPQVFGLYHFDGRIGQPLAGELVGWLILTGALHEDPWTLEELEP